MPLSSSSLFFPGPLQWHPTHRIFRSRAVFLPYPDSNLMIARLLPGWWVTSVKHVACICRTYALRQYHHLP
ncbi:hypothetical protein BDQ94DRAFT_133312 [Aspergillus welwitschiae]|uniref:Uncharacterized protein n=1 Tax=Aspergillus welwitschiae TaxID=1341132 RepID=A0A3F3QJQ1_9EURO|nr:hypothetical protein BDQ94DRAFT_133312 [Aspergillus welwitschiae]RDH39584.1 hypothetical protein BDQ94DRAFT_133312 [Aspergillus welwitschiae]